MVRGRTEEERGQGMLLEVVADSSGNNARREMDAFKECMNYLKEVLWLTPSRLVARLNG